MESMADLLLHVKDGYFFEVPRFLARYHWESLDQVPSWLMRWEIHKADPKLNWTSLDEIPQSFRDAHPVLFNVKEWNRAMDGTILIPQPFGTPKNLYEAGSGFCISRFMIVELVCAILLVAVFVRLANRVRKGGLARGSFWNMAEGMLEFLREKVIRPAIGEHDADRFVPLLWTMFFFILTCNLIGLVPWSGSPTGSFGVTIALAIIVFLTVLMSGMMRFGFIGYWKNLVPHMDLPFAALIVLWPAIFFIEVLGLLIRHAVLGFRLLANMAAGHLVLAAILGLIVVAAESTGTGQWLTVTVIAVIGTALLSLLELFVAFLQAYVFTFLSALFIGMAIHAH
jgi:F-type H+-transporting ATPase subunit a